MIKIPLIFVLLGVVYSATCVYDSANFQEIYSIMKNKQVQQLSKVSNNQAQTQLKILPDTTSQTAAVDSYTSSRISLLFVPLQIIDISSDLKENPTTLLKEDHIKAWEKLYGKIPADSLVLIRTDSNDKVFNGWEEDALEFLFEGRNVTGIGHDQLQDTLPDSQKKYFYNKMYITQTGLLDKNNDYGNLVQVRKLNEINPNLDWNVEIQSIIPESVCSTPRRLVNQWWKILIILTFLLGIIALIWYCCLKRFDKYNKEEFKPLDWENRNQEGIYFNKEELNVPLTDLNKSQH